MENTKPARIEWLDTLRALGMWFVVVGHIATGDTPDTFRFYIYAFHMPLFFMISGGAYYLQTRKGLADFKTTLKAKSKALLVPYFALNFICLFIWILNYKILRPISTPLIVKIAAIFYGNGKIAFGPTNATWFILTLFLTTMLFYLLERWSKGDQKLFVLMILVLGAFSYASSLRKNKFHTPWHFEIVPIAVMLFLMGYLFIKHIDTIQKLLGGFWRQFGIFFLLLTGGFGCAAVNDKVSLENHKYGSIFLFLGASIGFSGALTLIAMWIPKFRVLQYIGKNTIVCLAFHHPLFLTIKHTPIFIMKHLTEYPQLVSIAKIITKICTDYPLLISTIIYFLMIPLTLLFDKCFPQIIGKRRKRTEIPVPVSSESP